MIKSEKITISDYREVWPEQFNALKKVLIEHLNNDIVGIEHVGSTSIPGMKAKPIIDVDIIIEENDSIQDRVIFKLKELGYVHNGDQGIPGREAFKRKDSLTPNIGSNKEWFKHHLYVCKIGNIALLNHLNFRNYLKSNPNKVMEYSNLKQRLALKFPFDMDSYIDGKTNFIIDILIKTGIKNEDAKQIESQNRLENM
jgi:GrpB-like predicted nucleotidyltransferase (UPF0157 family)